jgi:fructose-1,6-bisphosphatase/inositol monophosphatase family enzyme
MDAMDDYKEFAVEFAKVAGAIMRKHFTVGLKKELKDDSSLSPVTIADLEINSALIDAIREKFPTHSILAEEESYFTEPRSEYLWICDPLDGTRLYAMGIPISAFSLALTKDGESLLGVIYDPYSDRLYVAEKGKGAFMNGKPIRVSERETLKGSQGDIEFTRKGKYEIFNLPGELLKNHGVSSIAKLPSIVYVSAMVAAGQYDFVVFPLTHAHDIAAAKVIVEEAGGKVTSLMGNEQRYDYDNTIDGALITNGKLHDELLKVVKEVVASVPQS